MRDLHNQDVLPERSKAERLINIFHPHDPIAYRIEPIQHENYRQFRYVIYHSCSLLLYNLFDFRPLRINDLPDTKSADETFLFYVPAADEQEDERAYLAGLQDAVPQG